MTEDQPYHLNLARLSFDELVDFLFSRPIMADFDQRYDAFYDGYGSFRPMPPEQLLINVAAMLIRWQELQKRFSREQLAQGLTELFAPAGFSLQDYLFVASVPMNARIQCVRALFYIYEKALPSWHDERAPDVFFMLWDNLNSEAASLLSKTPSAVESEILDAIFGTLARILELPDTIAQGCALHGLGHLPHSGVRSLVQTYMDSHRSDLSADELAWIEQCRDGTVM